MSKKLNTKNYNTTDLDPKKAFERHVFHRDMFGHYLRWTHILKEVKIGEKICDFGCGNGNLAEVLYRNKYKQETFLGLDIREKTIEQAKEKFEKVEWINFAAVDLCKNDYPYKEIQADRVCSFEVLEHVGKQNGFTFLQNFKDCGNEDAIYYLSTPKYDDQVGAAGNHTYDSGDGRGKAVQEFGYEELYSLLEESGFEIIDHFGTFASQRDYKPFMNEWQLEMFKHLKQYYDSNLVSNLMAPFFPEQSRNILWVLKKSEDDLL